MRSIIRQILKLYKNTLASLNNKKIQKSLVKIYIDVTLMTGQRAWQKKEGESVPAVKTDEG